MTIKGKSNSKKGIDRALGHLRRMDREDIARVAEKIGDERGLLSEILDKLREAVIVIDRWGEIQIINPSAREILGISDEKRVNLWRAAPELAGILKVRISGELELAGALTQEMEIHYPTLRLARLFATPIDDGARILIVLSDETKERENTTRDIEEARINALTQLSAGVAHELGNPLNALQIHLQLLERNLKKENLSSGKSKEIFKSLKTSRDEITRLDEIIKNFLQAIKPSVPNLQPSDVIATLEEVLAVMHVEFKNAKIKVSVEINSGATAVLPVVMADKEQLKQVFFNVLKNAREATIAGGKITIRAATDDEYLRVEFTDSGSGIAEEDLSHIFEPYFSTKPGGTGLGMMIVQKIMRAHQGNVSVASIVNEGTTVTLRFPLQVRRFKTLQASSSQGLPTLPSQPPQK